MDAGGVMDRGPEETWRDGVRTRMVASAVLGARQLCIFEQHCDPGLGAPPHRHAVEEVLEVLAGEAEVSLDGRVFAAAAGAAVLVPAGAWHGFRNTGAAVLHVRATLAAPIFEAQYESRVESGRRWSPERPDGGVGAAGEEGGNTMR